MGRTQATKLGLLSRTARMFLTITACSALAGIVQSAVWPLEVVLQFERPVRASTFAARPTAAPSAGIKFGPQGRTSPGPARRNGGALRLRACGTTECRRDG